MGTELQYALNLFSTSSKNHGDIVNIKTAEFWTSSTKGLLKNKFQTGVNQIRESMERMLEQYNRESMKKTMLKQEEIFKEQVLLNFLFLKRLRTPTVNFDYLTS